MATKAQEVQVLRDGIQANAPSPGSFALNMLYSNNCWQVREGFGQVTQFDTEMSAIWGGYGGLLSNGEWGFTKHLGSHLLKTNFGNLQMLSVFLATVSDGTSGGVALAGLSPLRTIYIVSIYDLTTNERFEVPLYPHTSQSAVAASYNLDTPLTLGGRIFRGTGSEGVQDILPQYQTCNTEAHDSYLYAEDDFFYFKEFSDILYFGNRHTGCWAYLPASFNQARPTKIDRLSLREYSQAYGESSMVVPVVLSPGINIEAFEYLRTADMPSPVDVAVVDNRLVYASGNNLYWSDPGFPSNIMADNFFAVPSEEEITAISEHNSNLMIFTENETWLYQPSVGDVVSRGRLTRVSDTVGCIGSNALCRVGGSVVWVDTSGVFQSESGLSIRPLSEDVLPFFQPKGMTNPLTSYFVKYGQADPSTRDQPTTTLRLKREGVKCTFVASMDMLVISIPVLSGALVMSAGKWSWWTFESMVSQSGGEAVAGVTQNLPSPWVLNYQDDVFAIAGPDVQSLTDEAVQGSSGSDINFDVTSRSFFIMEYGRGGSIDRSIWKEDDRKITGYGEYTAPRGTGASPVGGLYLHDPIKVPVGYVFNATTTATTDRFVLVPVSVVLPATPTAGIDIVEAKVAFDNTHWKPVFVNGSDADVQLTLPTERVASADGWSSSGSATGQLKVYTNNSSGSLSSPSQSGGFLHIRWNHVATSGYEHAPHMNLVVQRHSPLVYLPFERLSAKSDENTSGMGFQVLTDGSSDTLVVAVDSTAGVTYRLGTHVFNRWSLATTSERKEDSVAQPVDWAYKSTNVGLEGGNELKMRGLWANLMSHGTGSDKLDTAWPYGTFNTLVGSDRKEWMTQVIDATPAQAAVEQAVGTDTLRTRVQKSDGSLVSKSFQSGGTGVVWANKASSTTDPDGTVLIGNEDTSDISVSMSVKGQSFSVMNFGFIMNRAEKMWLEGVKAVFRIVGGRRRRGR